MCYILCNVYDVMCVHCVMTGLNSSELESIACLTVDQSTMHYYYSQKKGLIISNCYLEQAITT